MDLFSVVSRTNSEENLEVFFGTIRNGTDERHKEN